MDKLTGHHVLIPAYGRDYQGAAGAQSDFKAGKDWQHACNGICGPASGLYCSIRDFALGSQAELRYRSKTRLTLVRVTSE